MREPLASGRIVVLSPHLDDAVLSLGASMAAAARGGARVEVLTVFAGNTESAQPPGPWDRKSGFQSEGHAARARRDEDRAACGLLGVSPQWLPYADVQYTRGGDERDVLASLRAVAAGADTILLPGFPLLNPDHAWLTRLVLAADFGASRVGLYAEQPYLFTARAQLPQPPCGLLPARAGTHARRWDRRELSADERRQKYRAVRCYRSQLRQLGLTGFGLWRMLRAESRAGGEPIAWLE